VFHILSAAILAPSAKKMPAGSPRHNGELG
jgi:hypothetical protein